MFFWRVVVAVARVLGGASLCNKCRTARYGTKQLKTGFSANGAAMIHKKRGKRSHFFDDVCA